jgi:hypothetical protein
VTTILQWAWAIEPPNGAIEIGLIGRSPWRSSTTGKDKTPILPPHRFSRNEASAE